MRKLKRKIIEALAGHTGVVRRLGTSDVQFLKHAHETLSAQDPILLFEVTSDRNNLSRLAEDHGTDKGSVTGGVTPSGWLPHHYSRIYEPLLAGIRNQALKVLEVGIGSVGARRLANMGPGGIPGASLRMWRDYFPRATIFGADIDPRVIFRDERIETRIVDLEKSSSVRDLFAELPTPLDIIIDDGSHVTSHILSLFEIGFPHLADGGFFFIEDVSKLNLIKIIKKLKKIAPEAHISYSVADSVSARSLRSILVIVRKV